MAAVQSHCSYLMKKKIFFVFTIWVIKLKGSTQGFQKVMVCICSRKISGHSAKKTNAYDIDDFIKQLLSSQKFDELADKVADKAVKKIKNLAPGNLVPEKSPVKYNVEEAEEENVRIHGNEKEYVVYRDKDEGIKGDDIKQTKINTQALLKNDDSSQAELSLKYKHLKKHTRDKSDHNRQNAESNERNPWIHLDHSKPIQQYFVPDIEDKGHGDDDSPHSQISGEKNNDIEKNKKMVTHNKPNGFGRFINKNKHGAESVPRSKVDDDPNSRTPFKSQPSSGLHVIDIGGDFAKLEIADNKEDTTKNKREEVAENEDRSKRDSKEDMVRRAHEEVASEQSDIEETDNREEQPPNRVPGYELGELTTTKRVIRREGDRFYTYLSGPEYEEFHKEVARKQKSKDGNLD